MNVAVLRALALLFACTSLSAGELTPPLRKPGLWAQSLTGDLVPGGAARRLVCIDATTEMQNRATLTQYVKGKCKRDDTRNEGNTWINDSECTFSGTRAVSHSVTTVDGDRAFHADVHLTYDPPVRGKKSVVLSVDAKWLGDCASDSEASSGDGAGKVERLDERALVVSRG